MFQATRADKEDTRKMIHTINRSLDAPLAKELVDRAFDKMWPDLEAKLAAIPPTSTVAAPPRRTADEILAELLELNRVMTSQLETLLRTSEAERNRKELMDVIRQQWFSPGSGKTAKLSDLVDPDKLNQLFFGEFEPKKRPKG